MHALALSMGANTLVHEQLGIEVSDSSPFSWRVRLFGHELGAFGFFTGWSPCQQRIEGIPLLVVG
ncbi:MAG: hypothetical protein BWY17_05231 [Deltaproteobacteria bacterium ADurb.Bin207]|nr:MAG: hypothetical protein BWY17_05231 [Deltaproteobacteria bacterium ADurb.Bin207]